MQRLLSSVLVRAVSCLSLQAKSPHSDIAVVHCIEALGALHFAVFMPIHWVVPSCPWEAAVLGDGTWKVVQCHMPCAWGRCSLAGCQEEVEVGKAWP